MLRHRGVLSSVVVAMALLAVSACGSSDDTALEPLRGLDDTVATTDTTEGAEADEWAELAALDPDELAALVEMAEAAEGAEAAEVAAPPEGGEPGHGDPGDHDGRPFEELDLPPDEAPPPIEPGGHQPVSTPTPAPRGPAPPPPPSGELDPAVLAGVGDYCTLWRTYGGVGHLVDDALVNGPPARTASTLGFASALHHRASEIAPPERRGDHAQVGSAFAQVEALLAEFGHDYGAFARAAEANPALWGRFDAIVAPIEQPMIRVDQHISAACGVTLA
jgi:hypothetical protein